MGARSTRFSRAMKAIEKIEALSLKRVHAAVQELRPGLALETVYRWRAALREGKGVADDIKLLLIEATRETDQALAWADFAPAELAA